MRLISYDASGATWGVAMGDRVIEGRHLLGGRIAGIRALLEAGLLADALAEASGQSGSLSLDEVDLLPVIPEPGACFCIGLNYADHASETGKAAPAHPRIFLRGPQSLVGAGAPIRRPRASGQLDFEGELAVVIGRAGRHVPEERALDHVAGYTCFMDGSLRDWQKHSTSAGKNFAATGALGPAMVIADAVPNPGALCLTTRLNGVVVQQSNTSRMIHSIPSLIRYLSTMVTLQPGDVICTGTPEGVGSRRVPPLWMKPGDRIEVEIEDVGVLRNPIAEEE
ncbi:MAG: fumarylacetoacetate hydrolase family protein [Rhodobacteraceae bacterium]|nr:fumarylacetoacetate hydrolase family protein [Paracoccaceae bacterium]